MQVDYIDHMGSDLSVVNAARVSFHKESDWVYEDVEEVDLDSRTITQYKKPIGLQDRDKKLINFLARNGHWTPFGHTAITVRVKAPVFVRTQCFKHKVGFVENEVSRRYVKEEPEFFVPAHWRSAPENSKQGSGKETIAELRTARQSVDDVYSKLLDISSQLYNDMIDSGVAPEQARMVLPQSMYTQWYWTGSLIAFARFYNLRSKPDAQQEIQDVAEMIRPIISELYPVSWKALTNEH